MDFRNAISEKPEALVFRDADLRMCRFVGMDLRHIEFAAVTWVDIPVGCFIIKKTRTAVYDEVLWLEGETTSLYHIESSTENSSKTTRTDGTTIELVASITVSRKCAGKIQSRHGGKSGSPVALLASEWLRRTMPPPTLLVWGFTFVIYVWLSLFGAEAWWLGASLE